ncbi:DUF1232 domain-containing protein [Bacillus sp. B1-b2]|uniref:DUF1232 domain-containing protein n=1 Tax=Bacillus sp. B1-b2 TaxID=2653201 RepID=UPI001261766A|nr:DUF1232 domain-containing protein [Bacillus sp. B1-b2]KAB7665033.1 DUF1232 domain-containing protein [Bacillus sp. B1-b2]
MTHNNIDENELGHLLKTTLANKNISMSKLSVETNINKSTISRIINGNRKATPKHLQAFSNYLHIPIYTLFTAAGYTNDSLDSEEDGFSAKINAIQDMIRSSGVYSRDFHVEEVETQLNRYAKRYSTLEDPKDLLIQFKKKVTLLGSQGPFMQQLDSLYKRLKSNKGSTTQLLLIGSGLLYFVSTLDVIPDYLLPIGYLDDAIAINIIMEKMTKF